MHTNNARHLKKMIPCFFQKCRFSLFEPWEFFKKLNLNCFDNSVSKSYYQVLFRYPNITDYRFIDICQLLNKFCKFLSCLQYLLKMCNDLVLVTKPSEPYAALLWSRNNKNWMSKSLNTIIHYKAEKMTCVWQAFKYY